MGPIKSRNHTDEATSVKIIEQVQDDIKQAETSLGEPIYGPTVLLESSFIIACIEQNDSNHKGAKSLLGFIEPHNCRIHIPLLVSAEVLSKLIHKGRSVSLAIKEYENFTKSIPGILYVGTQPDFEEISSRYKDAARKKLKELQGNDFIIVTEGMIAGSIILTCDFKMYQKTKSYHKDIYFVATNSANYENDVTRFVDNFLSMIGATKSNGT